MGSSVSALADEKNTILWLYPDFPPIFISKGLDAGTGVGDRAQAYFEAELPQYKHEHTVSNFKRIIKTIGSGKQACSVILLKNAERAQSVEYSKPYMLAPQNEIITLKKHLEIFKPFMDEKGTVSLAEFLEAAPLIFGYSLGRSYTRDLDPIIKRLATGANSDITSGSNILEGLMRMLKFNRIGYTIGYGYEARYIATDFGIREEVVALPIRENARFIRVYVGCPKTPWGREIIEKVNAISEKAQKDPKILNIYQDWLDKDSLERYREAAKAYFSPQPAGAS